jgi:hypothetical protein
MPTTPNLSLSVKLDGGYTVLQEPATWHELDLGEIGPQGKERETGTVLIPGVGWRLATHRLWAEDVHELGEGASLNLLPSLGLATVASDSSGGWIEKPAQRWLSEIPGVPQGSQTTSGDLRLRKRVTTTANLSLTTDASGFPGPSMTEPVALDRSLVSVNSYDADDTITFGLQVPGNGGRTIGPIARFYFSSLGGTTAADSRAGKAGKGNMP